MNRSKLILALVLAAALVACNTWPTIIATAEGIAEITTIFFPGVGALAALAVKLLQDAEATAQAYQANKSEQNAAAYAAAIAVIEARLPAELQALNVPEADKRKVEAAVNIILDYVEALAVKAPPTAQMVRSARVQRQAGPVPAPMSHAQIKARWDAEVCGGQSKCAALVP